MQAQVRPVIEKLNTDSDFDVRYYASEAAMGNIYFRFIKYRISLDKYRIYLDKSRIYLGKYRIP